jgi:hypothetical protein
LHGITYEQGELSVLQGTATVQVNFRIAHKPEARAAFIRGCQAIKRALIEHDGFEEHHPEVARTGLHRFPVAPEHGHTQTSLILNGEPVAVRSLHSIKAAHGLSPHSEIFNDIQSIGSGSSSFPATPDCLRRTSSSLFSFKLA